MVEILDEIKNNKYQYDIQGNRQGILFNLPVSFRKINKLTIKILVGTGSYCKVVNISQNNAEG